MPWVKCYRHDCRADIALSDAFYDTLKRQREEGTFYCPYGHAQHFVSGETPEQKLRRERDRLAQQIAERDDAVRQQARRADQAERRLSATRGVVTRIRNRVGRGVCPCCSRSFSNLANHMQTKHPDYAEETEH